MVECLPSTPKVLGLIPSTTIKRKKKRKKIPLNESKTKQQPTEREKSFTNPTSDRGLISKIYKELKKLVIKRTNNSIKKWSTDLNRELSTDKSKMTETYLRRCSTSLAIREIQIKTTLRFHLTPVRMAKIKKTLMTTYAGEVVGKREHFCIAGESANWYSPFGCQCGDFSEN